jgi:hypothetical protein
MMRRAQIFQIVVRLAWSAFIFALCVFALYEHLLLFITFDFIVALGNVIH